MIFINNNGKPEISTQNLTVAELIMFTNFQSVRGLRDVNNSYYTTLSPESQKELQFIFEVGETLIMPLENGDVLFAGWLQNLFQNLVKFVNDNVKGYDSLVAGSTGLDYFSKSNIVIEYPPSLVNAIGIQKFEDLHKTFFPQKEVVAETNTPAEVVAEVVETKETPSLEEKIVEAV